MVNRIESHDKENDWLPLPLLLVVDCDDDDDDDFVVDGYYLKVSAALTSRDESFGFDAGSSTE
jgi:hypothetical protein